MLRPTWHFALPGDIAWLLRLTAPRLRRLMAFYNRQQGLDPAELDRVAAGARRRGVRRTAPHPPRTGGGADRTAGIEATGQRLGFIRDARRVRRGADQRRDARQQQTYAAFDERVPAGPAAFDEDEALAELARRYAATRAPVTAKDFASWASLTIGQARAGLEAAGCEGEELDGTVVFHPPGDRTGRPGDRRPRGNRPGPRADLLQGYDELIMSYSESRGRLTAGAGIAARSGPDQLSARRADRRHAWPGTGGTDSTRGAVVDPGAADPGWSAAEHAAVSAAAADYGRYLGCPTSLE